MTIKRWIKNSINFEQQFAYIMIAGVAQVREGSAKLIGIQNLSVERLTTTKKITP